MKIDFTYRKIDDRPVKKPKLTTPGIYAVEIRGCNNNVDLNNGDETTWVNFDVIGEGCEYNAPFHLTGNNRNEWDVYNFSRLLDACLVQNFTDTDQLTGKILNLTLEVKKVGSKEKLIPSFSPSRNQPVANQSFDYNRQPNFINDSSEPPF